jgi:hypothetical protein
LHNDHIANYYDDPTLLWAKSNPHVAQNCLHPPPLPPPLPSSETFRAKTASLESYLKWRRWHFPQEIYDDDDKYSKAVALTSHVLSTPLTLASQIEAFYSTRNTHKNDGSEEWTIDQQRWCCVGARAEASLPLVYWKEFLLLGSKILLGNSTKNETTTGTRSHRQDNAFRISLEFTGPDILPNLPKQSVSIPPPSHSTKDVTFCSSIIVSGGFRGLYHENSEIETNDRDAFIFFNPGFGHDNLRKSWEATLGRIIKQRQTSVKTSRAPRRVLLVTAHSEKDADRDSRILSNDYGLNVTYSLNPFASRITYQDPFDEHHFVRPNHYVAVVSF